MKILLDENFPLQLYRRLSLSGYEVEHIIVLGKRGIPDSYIRERITKEDIVFLTQDTEFERMPENPRGVILISRVKQSLPIQTRTEIWFTAIKRFIDKKTAGKLFALLETGEVVAWEPHKTE